MGCPIIMGRRSWEALGRALPGRTNIVITRTPGYEAEGALVVSSVDEALQIAREETARTDAPTSGSRAGLSSTRRPFPSWTRPW